MPATFEPIASTTLSGSASTITFSTIPGTYTDLRLVFAASFSASGSVYIRYNSDTGTNYSITTINGNGTAAGSERLTSADKLYVNYKAAFGIDLVGLYTVDIFSYAGSTNKTSLHTASNDKNGSGTVESIVGLWRSTSAITSITLTSTNSGNITGTATLYGITKA